MLVKVYNRGLDNSYERLMDMTSEKTRRALQPFGSEITPFAVNGCSYPFPSAVSGSKLLTTISAETLVYIAPCAGVSTLT